MNWYKIPTANSVAHELKNGLANGTVDFEEIQDQPSPVKTNQLYYYLVWAPPLIVGLMIFIVSFMMDNVNSASDYSHSFVEISMLLSPLVVIACIGSAAAADALSI